VTNKQELNQEALEKINGGAGFDVTIHIILKIIYKYDEHCNDLKQQITLTFHKKYTTYVSDTEIEDACKEWCENRCYLYVDYEIIEKISG